MLYIHFYTSCKCKLYLINICVHLKRGLQFSPEEEFRVDLLIAGMVLN